MGGGSRSDVEAQQEIENRLRDSLVKWVPKLKPILLAMLGGSDGAKQDACQQLAEIKDAAAAPSLELLLSMTTEECAALLVNKLDEWQSPAISEALSRQSIYSPWGSIRELAAGKLKTRPKDEFVPQMLAIMKSPTEIVGVSAGLNAPGPNGQPVLRMAVIHEGRDAWEFQTLSTFYTAVNQDGTRTRNAQPIYMRGMNGIALDMRKAVAALQRAVVLQNLTSEEINSRTIQSLSEATGTSVLVRPDDWMNWWDQQNETQYARPKQIVRSAVERDVILSDSDPYNPEIVGTTDYHEPIVRIPPHSCFVSGTQVWTLTGRRRIETIRVGDLVLSQDPDSAELTFKPVIATTVRPGTQVFSLETAGETLRCTGGHLFWVAGQGWTKARNLKSGQTLHCASGTVQVSLVTEEPQPGQTYNLVVADFNTYFVGPEKILSHDVTEKKPTRSIVPGLAKD